MTKCERRFTTLAGQIESRNDEETGIRTVSGYAAVFYRDSVDGTEYEMAIDLRERIMPGAFDRALAERDDTRALFNHNPDNLLARYPDGNLRLSVDDIGLRYEFDADPNDPDHARVLAKLDRGDLSGSSFAFIAERAAWVEDRGVDIRQVESVRLFDVGPVTYPAYDASTVAARNSDGAADLAEERDAWKAMQAVVDRPIPSGQ